MTDLTDVTDHVDEVSASIINQIKDYIEDATHRVNTLSLSVGGTEVIDSSRNLTNIGTLNTYTIPSANIVGTTSSQTLTNKTIAAGSNTISGITNTHISSGAAIDATKIANGSVSNTEFQYLDGVTSAIQTQINNKTGRVMTVILDPSGTGDATTLSGALSSLGTSEGKIFIRTRYLSTGTTKHTLKTGQVIEGETGSGTATFIDTAITNGDPVIEFEITTKDSGTTTSTSANHLVQTGQNFTSTVSVGDTVHNTTDDTYAEVTAVNSNTDLTLDVDIMASGETFIVGQRCFGAGLRNIHLNSDGSGWSKAIRLGASRDCRLENVRAYNFNGSGLYCNDAWDWYIHGCEWNKCGSVAHTEASIHLVAGTSAYYHNNNELKFSQCLIEADYWKAILINDYSLANKWNSVKIHGAPVNYNTVEMSGSNVEKQSFTDCTFVNQGTSPVMTLAGKTHVINGCTWVGNLGKGITGAGTGHTITGNSFRDSSGNDIDLTCTNSSITGNAGTGTVTFIIDGDDCTVTGNNCTTLTVSGDTCTSVGNRVTGTYTVSGANVSSSGNNAGTITFSDNNITSAGDQASTAWTPGGVTNRISSGKIGSKNYNYMTVGSIGIVTGINLKTTGATLIFSPVSGKHYYVDSVVTHCTAQTGTPNGPAVTWGENASSYDNYTTATLGAMTPNTSEKHHNTSGFTAGTNDFYIKVATGSTATTMTGTAVAHGYYVD